MRYLPVHWSEGMFLRPQHFQSADRYWQQEIASSEAMDHEYNYGLRAVEFSREAIANQHFELVTCKARLRDGTLITLELGQDPDRIDLAESLSDKAATGTSLKSAFQQGSSVQVLLAVPKLRLGRPNVARNGASQGVRFMEVPQKVPDESAGERDQQVEFRSLNVRLFTSTEEASGYEFIPIARVKRSSDEKAVPALDEDYIPPLLAIDAWPPLSIGIVRAIYDIISQKIKVLTEQIVSRGIALSSDSPSDLERIHMLMILQQASASLGCLTFAAGVHPFTAYWELCRIVGALSIFHPARQLPEFPRYDHDNLGIIFPWLKKQIEGLLSRIRDYEFFMRYFIGAGKGMRVALDSKWFTQGWNWFIGVNYSNVTKDECIDLLKSGTLDWKMGSSDKIEYLFVKRIPGLELRQTEQTPRELPRTSNWVYYQVGRGTPAFYDVQSSETLAMRFTDTAIMNLAQLEGQKSLAVAYKNKQVNLEVALFAVPPTQTGN